MRSVFSKILISLVAVVIMTCGVFSFGVSAAEENTVIMSAAELESALNVGGSISLGCDVVLSSMLTVPEGIDLTLDLCGHNLSMVDPANTFVINNRGRLVINDTVGGGEVNSRGIYNGYDSLGIYVTEAELTVNGGVFNAKGTNGGAAIFNYGRAEVNGGVFTSVGLHSIINRSGAEMIINDAEATGGVQNMGTLTVNGGSISNSKTGKAALLNSNSLTVNGGSFTNYASSATVSSSSKSAAVINGGKFYNEADNFIFDGLFTVSGGEFYGGIRSKGLTVSGGVFNNMSGKAHNVTAATVTGGTFVDSSSLNVAESYISPDHEIIKNDDGSYSVLSYEGIVLAGAKYNVTTTSSFVGNLYIKVPSSDSDITVNAEDSIGYSGIESIDGVDYYVFKSAPSMSTVTGIIEFAIQAIYKGSSLTVEASFTTDSYFAAVMSLYSNIESPTNADIENMTLVMNATRYANELYKYATESGDYEAYAKILENKEYQKYLTNVTKDSVAGDVISGTPALSAVFDYATLEIKTGYGANYLFGVSDGYDVSDITRVTISYIKIGWNEMETAITELDYVPSKNAYVAPEMPIYDMIADLTITVSFGDGREDAVGEYNLATYASGSDSAIGYAIWAYANAAYEYKVVRSSEK